MPVPKIAFPSIVRTPSFPEGLPQDLNDCVVEQVRTLYAKHGPAAFAMPKDAAAAHEAGHAIVGTHEGLAITGVKIFSRQVPLFGEAWAGLCDGEAWRSDPGTSPEDDIRNSRMTIAGLAGEAFARVDKPASSLDELVISQMLGANAVRKLKPELNLEQLNTESERHWHEQIWRAVLLILRKNAVPFTRLSNYLFEKEKIRGDKLRKILAQIKPAPCPPSPSPGSPP